MIPILVDGPAVEPVPLERMKAYLRVDDDGQDELIAGLVTAARLMVEAASRRFLVAQRWRLFLDRWPPQGVVALPLSPLIACDSVRVFDADGVGAEVPAEAVAVDAASDPPCLAVASAPAPGLARNGIAIDLVVGYGAGPDAVPAPLKLAVMTLVARWFENRGDVAGQQFLPPEALALLAPFRRARL